MVHLKYNNKKSLIESLSSTRGAITSFQNSLTNSHANETHSHNPIHFLRPASANANKSAYNLRSQIPVCFLTLCWVAGIARYFSRKCNTRQVPRPKTKNKRERNAMSHRPRCRFGRIDGISPIEQCYGLKGAFMKNTIDWCDLSFWKDGTDRRNLWK